MQFILLLEETQRQHQVQRVIRDRTNDLEILNDEEIIKKYRLSRHLIFDLCEELQTDLRRPTCRSNALTVYQMVLCALRFYAVGNFQATLGYSLGLSRWATARCVHDVSRLLTLNAKNNIYMPRNTTERAAVKEGFFKVAGFPNVLGVIDGSCVPIKAPSIREEVYVCRKGFHAINIQGIMDSDMIFQNVVARWPGSTHDSYMLLTSAVSAKFESKNYGTGWLLGDSGYGVKSWLLTPLLAAVTPSEKRYNKAHKSTRCIVEKGFGVWKMRFRCLHKSGGHLNFSPEKCANIIVATARLHNLCIRSRLPLDGEEENREEDNGSEDRRPEGETNIEGEHTRISVINNIFGSSA